MESLQVRKMINKPNPFGLGMLHRKQRTSGGSCPLVQWLSRTSRYYPEGIQKVAYILWSRVRLPVRFVERTSGGPPAYVRTTDNSVCLPNLAYVCPKVQITPLAALVTQSPN
jgi:hypothetical protein